MIRADRAALFYQRRIDVELGNAEVGAKDTVKRNLERNARDSCSEEEEEGASGVEDDGRDFVEHQDPNTGGTIWYSPSKRTRHWKLPQMMRFERNLVGERIKVQWKDRVGNDPQTNPLRWYDGTVTHLNCRRVKHRVKYVHPAGPMVTANQRHVELESEWLELRNMQDQVQIENVETGVWEEFRFRRPTKEEEDMHLITDQMTWEDIDALQRVERRKQLLGDAYEGVVRKEREAREAREAAEAMQQLVYSGADVNAKDKQGYTVLMKEAHAGHAAAVEVLLRGGADHAIRAMFGDWKGKLPVDLAEMAETDLGDHAAVVALLTEAAEGRNFAAAEEEYDEAIAFGARPDSAGPDAAAAGGGGGYEEDEGYAGGAEEGEEYGYAQQQAAEGAAGYADGGYDEGAAAGGGGGAELTPEGWERHVDEFTGAVFFFDPATGESKWEGEE